jgi:hypothetical protein
MSKKNTSNNPLLIGDVGDDESFFRKYLRINSVDITRHASQCSSPDVIRFVSKEQSKCIIFIKDREFKIEVVKQFQEECKPAIVFHLVLNLTIWWTC